MDTHDANTPHRSEPNRAVRRGKRRNNDGDGSTLHSRIIVGLRDGMLLLLAGRARQHGRWQDSIRGDMFVYTFDGPVIPFGANVSVALSQTTT